MGHTFIKSSGIFLLIVGNLATQPGPAVAQRALATYAVTDLGTLGGGSSEAAAINNLGDIVGTATTADGAPHAFLYRNGRVIDLGTLPGGTASYATAINDRGDVVGYSGINAYGPQFREFVQGFVWQDGAMRSVGTLYCPCSFNVRYGTSQAFAVSNAGWVVGDSQTNRGTFRSAFIWDDALLRGLNFDASNPADAHAYGINDIHEIVGDANDRAFLAHDGVSRDLGVLPGYATSSARAVNNKGQVIGSAATGAGIARAFLWDLGTLRDLGTLPGDLSSQALAINGSSAIVGRSGDADFSRSRAVLWHDGSAIDLNGLISTSGWTLATATGINESGQIVGVAVRGGQPRAVLLTPQ